MSTSYDEAALQPGPCRSERDAAGTELFAVLGKLLVDDDVRYLNGPLPHPAGLVLLTLGPLQAEDSLVGHRSIAKEKLVDK